MERNDTKRIRKPVPSCEGVQLPEVCMIPIFEERRCGWVLIGWCGSLGAK